MAWTDYGDLTSGGDVAGGGGCVGGWGYGCHGLLVDFFGLLIVMGYIQTQRTFYFASPPKRSITSSKF